MSSAPEGSPDHFHQLVIDAYGGNLWNEEFLPSRFNVYGAAVFLSDPSEDPPSNMVKHNSFLQDYTDALWKLWSGYPDSASSLIEAAGDTEGKEDWSLALELELYERLDRQDVLAVILEKALASGDQETAAIAYPYGLAHLESVCDWDGLEALVNRDIGGGRVDRFQEFMHEASLLFARGDAKVLLDLLNENRDEYSELFEFQVIEANWKFLSEGYSGHMQLLREIYQEFSGTSVMRSSNNIDRLLWGPENGSEDTSWTHELHEYIEQYGRDIRGVVQLAIQLAKFGEKDQFALLLNFMEPVMKEPNAYVGMDIVRAYEHIFQENLDKALALLDEAVDRSPGNREAHLARLRVAQELGWIEPWENSVIRLNECDPFDDESVIFLRQFVSLVGSDRTRELLQDVRRHRHLFSEPIQQLLQ